MTHSKLSGLCLSLVLALALAACAAPRSMPAAGRALDEGPQASAMPSSFYISGPISLVQFDNASQKINGKSRVERKQIRAGTPGVVMGKGEGWMAVSFEPGSYVYFTRVDHNLSGARIADSRVAGRYYLYLPDWDGRAGTVKLGEQEWLAVDASREVYLVATQADSARSSLSGAWLDEKR